MPFPPVPCVISVGLACHIRQSRVTSPPVSAMRARSAARGSGTGVPARGPLVDEEPGPRVPRPGRKPLLRRDGGRGLPWTRGRLGDGTGHRAPQPWRRPPPGGESYATRRPGGSPGGRLGEGRETRHTRATADGPRDGVVTRDGPGRGRTGAAALPTVPESGSRLRSNPPRLMRPAGLGGPVRRGGWSGNHTPRAPVDSGLPLLESVRGTKWRSGRIVPLRTRLRCRRNRGITRKSPGVSEVPVRTILPERQNQVPPGFPAPAALSAGCPTGAWPARRPPVLAARSQGR